MIDGTYDAVDGILKFISGPGRHEYKDERREALENGAPMLHKLRRLSLRSMKWRFGAGLLTLDAKISILWLSGCWYRIFNRLRPNWSSKQILMASFIPRWWPKQPRSKWRIKD